MDLLAWKLFISIVISVIFVPKFPMANKPGLVRLVAFERATWSSSWQTNTWGNEDPAYWRMYRSAGHNKFDIFFEKKKVQKHLVQTYFKVIQRVCHHELGSRSLDRHHSSAACVYSCVLYPYGPIWPGFAFSITAEVYTNQASKSQQTPHTSPLRVNYRVSIIKWVQIVGYVLACISYPFVCILHHRIIIIVQNGNTVPIASCNEICIRRSEPIRAPTAIMTSPVVSYPAVISKDYPQCPYHTNCNSMVQLGLATPYRNEFSRKYRMIHWVLTNRMGLLFVATILSVSTVAVDDLWPLLLKWFNFYPSIDE